MHPPPTTVTVATGPQDKNTSDLLLSSVDSEVTSPQNKVTNIMSNIECRKLGRVRLWKLETKNHSK